MSNFLLKSHPRFNLDVSQKRIGLKQHQNSPIAIKTFTNRSNVESQKQLGKFDSLPLISTQHHQSVANYKKVTIDTVTPEDIKTLSKKLQESRCRGKPEVG